MKRYVKLILACALVLAVVSTAVAQSVPTPVVRMGDWLEISDDVWMNLIFNTEWNYVTNHNNDFEDDIQDETSSSDTTSTTVHSGDCDCLWEETRFGADLRYKKNLRVRVLFEQQSTMDGNAIDGGENIPDDDDPEGRRRNNVNLERAWIQYDVPNTGLTMEVGARLWALDQARVIGDDDPRFALFYKTGNLEFQAAAVIQTESLRIGLENDNDNVYYTFGIDYKAKPWSFGLHGAYFRWRNLGAVVQPTVGQKQDSVLIMPSVRGQAGIVKFLLQPMVIFGEADRSDTAVDAGASRSLDIFSWGVIGGAEANLGKIRPFFAFAIGSGDDNPDDNDLEGFAPTPRREITLTTGAPEFSVLTRSPSWGTRDVSPPARSSALDVSNEFLHSVGNPFNDRIGSDGSNIHGLDTTYANPGTLTLIPGVKIFPVKGHELDLWYAYRRIMESAPIERLLNDVVNVDESILHEISFMYTWKVNKHFDIRAVGNLSLLASGGQDIAETVVCDEATGQTCKGEDIALRGQIRFRARF